MKRINHTSNGENLMGILLSISIGFALILFSPAKTNAQSTEIIPATTFISNRIRVQQIYTSQIGIREKQPNSGSEVEKYLRYVHLSKGNPWCAAFVCWVFGQAGVPNPRSGWSPDLFGEGRVVWGRGEQGTRSKDQGFPPSAPNGEARIKYQESRFKPVLPSFYPPSLATGNSQQVTEKEQGTMSKEQRLTPKLPGNYTSSLATGNSQLVTQVEHGTKIKEQRHPTSATPRTGDIFGLYFPEKKRIAHVGFIDQWDGTWMISVEGNTNDSGSREGDGVYRKRRLVRTIHKVAQYINE